MKIFGFTPPRQLVAIFILGIFMLGLWYFDFPPASKMTSTTPPAPAPGATQSQQTAPASQAPISNEPGKLTSPEPISNRAAEKVKVYAEVRRKLRSGEITTLPADLAPPPIPEPIEPPLTNP